MTDRARSSLVVLHYGTSFLFLLLQVFLASASGHFKEAVLQPDGTMIGSGQQRRVMRRQEGDVGDTMMLEKSKARNIDSSEAMKEFFKFVSGVRTQDISKEETSLDGDAILRKIKNGLSATAQVDGKTSSDPNAGAAPSIPWPEKWLGEDLEALEDECHLSVGVDKGESDYGKVGHSCAACGYECTASNSQKKVGAAFTFSPPLSSKPAKAAHFYTLLESVNGLGCSHCSDWKHKHDEHGHAGHPMALTHEYELEFSTSAAGDTTFKAHVGAYLEAGSGAVTFPGTLFFVMKDTVPPQDINGCKKNPANRRFALEGANRNGELFQCERFCSQEHGCPCGFDDALGCNVHAHIGTGMMIKFAIRETADEAMAPMLDVDNIEKTLGGQQWEVVATFGLDNSSQRIEATIGRVVLEGNSYDQGIVSMKSSLEHKGCVPCDMFYSSVVSVGPFVTEPTDSHWVSSSTFEPPERTSDSCELFRVTADRGKVLRFESGPGLVAATQDPATLFTCPLPTKGTEDIFGHHDGGHHDDHHDVSDEDIFGHHDDHDDGGHHHHFGDSSHLAYRRQYAAGSQDSVLSNRGD